ncbi:tyrosine-type recombinase/integrase [Geomesophilobacter sediminis]|uniref:Site-specific integrase n=1 Tax=Geomesophilobacter sediminis TaxID=2798584 RepID=A0A8J7M1B0_9BACT|nr:site-specific integrase [Geomesophilobacter sediminis]MBJ6726807.1 site-specific integrase [Geomesophilobacter sediminis]
MSVYRRGKVYVFDFVIDGNRYYGSTKKQSKREAKQAEAKERARVLSGTTKGQKTANVLLSDAIEQIYDSKWKSNKDGYGSYQRARKLLEVTGNVVLSSVGDDVVQDLIRKLESSGVSVATVNRYLATLKTIMKHFRLQVDHIKLKKERNGRIRVLTKDEEQMAIELLRGAEGQGKRPYYTEAADMVVVLVDTGMRLSELLNLKYEDVNFGRNLISIWINKGDRPRSIPMTTRVRTILEQRKHLNKVKPFTISKAEMERAWQWCRAGMGLDGDKEFVLHALRHTCASRLINAGIDVMVVKEWLGHSSVQITERYSHLNPIKLVQAVEVLEVPRSQRYCEENT